MNIKVKDRHIANQLNKSASCFPIRNREGTDVKPLDRVTLISELRKVEFIVVTVIYNPPNWADHTLVTLSVATNDIAELT